MKSLLRLRFFFHCTYCTHVSRKYMDFTDISMLWVPIYIYIQYLTYWLHLQFCFAHKNVCVYIKHIKHTIVIFFHCLAFLPPFTLIILFIPYSYSYNVFLLSTVLSLIVEPQQPSSFLYPTSSFQEHIHACAWLNLTCWKNLLCILRTVIIYLLLRFSSVQGYLSFYYIS